MSRKGIILYFFLGIAEGGVVDLIQHNSTGFMSNPGQNEQTDFISFVNKLANNELLRNSMGVAGRRLAESWSWEKSNQNLREVLYPTALANFKKRRKGFWGKYKYEL